MVLLSFCDDAHVSHLWIFGMITMLLLKIFMAKSQRCAPVNRSRNDRPELMLTDVQIIGSDPAFLFSELNAIRPTFVVEVFGSESDAL
jgi:hypothetical protein